ncbi:hypothetical protein BDZ89DRAFT_1058644 [Hymenopellis radicata]|nr:hypothetical protein BDZ89DRAFT_1058644 [Hymenopellis radicata]
MVAPRLSLSLPTTILPNYPMAENMSQLSKENEAPRSERAATSSSSKTSNHQEEQQPLTNKPKADQIVYYRQPAVPPTVRIRKPLLCLCPLCTTM